MPLIPSGYHVIEGAWFKGIDLSDRNLRNLFFK